MKPNYEDERFQQIEDEKLNQLNQNQQEFDKLQTERNDLQNQQNDLVNRWEQTQNENLDKQLEFQKDLIDQQKAEANKNYEREARSAYGDYRKETDAYGVSREKLAESGLGNTGYAESSRVSMYNAYQNRLGSAKQSMDKAFLEFNNAIREAQLGNDVKKAENALASLQQKLQISLQGFDYKNTNTLNKLNRQDQINNNYYNKYQNVLGQINLENQQAEDRRRYEAQVAEDLRRYNDQMAYKKEQDRIAQQRWEREQARLERAMALEREKMYLARQAKAAEESLGIDVNEGSNNSTNENVEIKGDNKEMTKNNQVSNEKVLNTNKSIYIRSKRSRREYENFINSVIQRGGITKKALDDYLDKSGKLYSNEEKEAIRNQFN